METVKEIKSMDSHIEEVMDNFNWIKVRDVMDFLEWKWFPEEEVPEITRIKKTAQSLLEEVAKAKREESSIGTGGFTARKFRGEEGLPELSLTFELTSTESCS